jgi:hypothetical protein
MLHEMFAVYDKKAQTFGKPFQAINKDVAGRIFITAVNDEKTDLAKYPEDYVLYHLGQFDDETGMMETASPESFIDGLSASKLGVNKDA